MRTRLSLMATRWRACPVPRCPHLRPCPVHARQADRARGNSRTVRGYGWGWITMRARYLRMHPLCVACGATASDVDHVIPKARGGTDDASNLQALCHACHSRKTARESSGWGRRRT